MVIVVGNNKTGREGALRCSNCRKRKSKVSNLYSKFNYQCVFTAPDIPCQSCRARGMSDCIKQWGPKREEILGRQLPTAIDGVIDPEDVPLLQFAYSDHFLGMAGNLVGGVLRKFAGLFRPSMSSESLRQATLAWASAFVSSAPSAYTLMVDNSISAGRALASKNSNTIDEADLYASFLLCILSCAYSDSKQFAVHLNGFVAIMMLLKKKNWQQGEPENLPESSHLSLFLPLARDSILEMSRRVHDTNTLIIKFLYMSGHLIRPASFHQRARYHHEFCRNDPFQYRSFTDSVWHHYTALRRCFRDTLFLQVEGGVTSEFVRSLVSEIEIDLLSQKELVDHLSMETQILGANIQSGSYELLRFSLALYQLCRLLILLLNAATLKQGVALSEAVASAKSLLHHIQCRWLAPGNCGFLINQSIGTGTTIIIRMLCICGLILNPKNDPEGSRLSLYLLTSHPASKLIICKLEKTEEALLIIKTMNTHYAELELMIKKQHPYETPEIIALTIEQGSEKYLAFIQQSLERIP